MFDNPYPFLKFFGILIAVVFLIYRFQLFITIIEGFKKWRTGKDKYEADKLEYQKLQTQLDEIVNESEMSQLNKSTIKIDLLKIVNSEEQYSVYFSINGGSVIIKSITSKDIKITEIKPEGYIPNKSSAHFSFTKVNTDKNTIFLEVTFEDQFTVNHTKNYVLSISENMLKEII